MKERQPLGALSKVWWLLLFKPKIDLNICRKGKVSIGRELKYSVREGPGAIWGAHGVTWGQGSTCPWHPCLLARLLEQGEGVT